MLSQRATALTVVVQIQLTLSLVDPSRPGVDVDLNVVCGAGANTRGRISSDPAWTAGMVTAGTGVIGPTSGVCC
jgi:hypothetical protein